MAISFIGFISRNRAEVLARGLRSYVQNAKAFGRSPRVIVADGSQDEVTRRQYRELLKTARQTFGVETFYAGIDEKRRYIEILSNSCAVPRSILEFALLDPETCGYSPGANRNALLLHTLGESFFSADDDSLARLNLPPEEQTGIRVSSSPDPTSYWSCANRAEVLSHLRPVEEDLLAWHEKVLGKPPFDALNALGDSPCTLDDAEPSFVQKINTNRGRVMLSWTGFAGDAGAGKPTYMLWFTGEERERLTKSEAHYTASRISRQVVRAVPRLTIGEGVSCQSIALAFDNSQGLPPFMPVQRGEDVVYGWMFRQCFPEGYIAYLPRVVVHDPIEPRSNRPDDIWNPAGYTVQFGNFMELLKTAPPMDATMDAWARIQQIGDYFQKVAGLALTDYEDILRRSYRQTNQDRCDYFTHLLKRYKASPAYWAEDLHKFILEVERSKTAADFMVPDDLRAGRTIDEARHLGHTLTRRFGELLSAWPEILQTARALKNKGIQLAQPID